MAAKVKLGQRPASIKSTVKFKMPDGEEGVIVCTFKYRTRDEFAAFVDQLTKDAIASADAEVKAITEGAQTETPEEAFSMARIAGRATAQNVSYLQDVLIGWDIEGAELNEENLAALANEHPGAVAAIMGAYNDACMQGRLGN